MSQRHCHRNLIPLLVVVLVASLGLGAAWWQNGAIGQVASAGPDPKAVYHASELSKAFRDASHIAMPSVVTIVSKVNAHPVKGVPRGENPFKGTPFEDFFGDKFDFGDMAPHGRAQRGMGSGVIIDKSGTILTNNHVVEGADEVIVHLADGREFKAEDIKTDEFTDIAVLKISGAGNLPAAKLGDSDKMEIGDWVLAIGNPFELEQTVSAGIISGKGRELSSVRRAKFLQTDAAINPGNSGGPLVNLDGEVVGINTAIATNNGSFQGVGFAIPVNLAKWVMDQLMEKGSVQRAYLGVGIGQMNKELASQFGVEAGQGILVNEVFPNSPAAAAGVKNGDVITEFDGQKVADPRKLQELVEQAPLDSHRKLTVIREGKNMSLDVTAKAMPKQFGGTTRLPLGDRGKSQPDAVESNQLGLEVTDLSSDRAEQSGYKGFEGVMISKVSPEGAAAEQGLRPGMLIMKVGKTPVKSVKEFEGAMKNESVKQGVLLLVRTPRGNQFVVVQQD